MWALQRATTRDQSCRLHNSRRSLATGSYRRRNLELKIFAETFPLTLLTLKVRIQSVSTNTTPSNCILFEVEGFRIWHSIENCAKCADLPALRADKSADPCSAFSVHVRNLHPCTDKNYLSEIPRFIISSVVRMVTDSFIPGIHSGRWFLINSRIPGDQPSPPMIIQLFLYLVSSFIA